MIRDRVTILAGSLIVAGSIVLAVILGTCPLCCQPVTLDRFSAALAGT